MDIIKGQWSSWTSWCTSGIIIWNTSMLLQNQKCWNKDVWNSENIFSWQTFWSMGFSNDINESAVLWVPAAVPVKLYKASVHWNSVPALQSQFQSLVTRAFQQGSQTVCVTTAETATESSCVQHNTTLLKLHINEMLCTSKQDHHA